MAAARDGREESLTTTIPLRKGNLRSSMRKRRPIEEMAKPPMPRMWKGGDDCRVNDAAEELGIPTMRRGLQKSSMPRESWDANDASS